MRMWPQIKGLVNNLPMLQHQIKLAAGVKEFSVIIITSPSPQML